MAFTRLGEVNRPRHVVESILSSIQDGSLVAGERMPSEAKLAELTGVGRTSVREALAALRLMGVVETRVGDGSYVASVNGVAEGAAANAIADAIGNLNEKKLDYCLIGGIDSFLEEKTLHWLHNTGRLKTSENPYGFHPGEAGAFLLAERYKTAVQRGASILLTIVVSNASL